MSVGVTPCDYCRLRHAEGSPCTAMNVTSPVCINMTGQANYCYSTHNSLSLSLSHLKYEIPRPRKYWTFVMSWHKDQWRNDLVVICMKTCNLGIYLNFKNLSKTWHVNTQTNRYIMEFSYPTLPFTFKCYGFCIKCKEVRSVDPARAFYLQSSVKMFYDLTTTGCRPGALICLGDFYISIKKWEWTRLLTKESNDGVNNWGWIEHFTAAWMSWQQSKLLLAFTPSTISICSDYSATSMPHRSGQAQVINNKSMIWSISKNSHIGWESDW